MLSFTNDSVERKRLNIVPLEFFEIVEVAARAELIVCFMDISGQHHRSLQALHVSKCYLFLCHNRHYLLQQTEDPLNDIERARVPR